MHSLHFIEFVRAIRIPVLWRSCYQASSVAGYLVTGNNALNNKPTHVKFALQNALISICADRPCKRPTRVKAFWICFQQFKPPPTSGDEHSTLPGSVSLTSQVLASLPSSACVTLSVQHFVAFACVCFNFCQFCDSSFKASQHSDVLSAIVSYEFDTQYCSTASPSSTERSWHDYTMLLSGVAADQPRSLSGYSKPFTAGFICVKIAFSCRCVA